MIRKGGYIIVDLTSTNLYANLQEAIASQKPILLVDGVHTPLYATQVEQGTNKIIINGQFVVNSDNTTSGEITGLVLEGIYDKNGNARFIEGSGILNEISGVTYTYNKYSLSGTHLMMVVCGEIADTTVIPSDSTLVAFKFPTWINDKIDVTVGNYIDERNIIMYNTSASTVQNANVVLRKTGDTIFITIEGITLTDDRIFRIQFDLLIDNE